MFVPHGRTRADASPRVLYGNSRYLDEATTEAIDIFWKYKKGESLKADSDAMSVHCNDGFVWIALLVEKVSRMTYTDFVRNNIPKALSLRYATTAIDSDYEDRWYYAGTGRISMYASSWRRYRCR